MKNGGIIDMAVIGGGASGLAAAISCAAHLKEQGKSADIVIFERLDRVGKKLLATGNGKCNLSNLNVSPEHYHAKKGFVDYALGEFDVKSNLEFFKNLSLLCIADCEGRVYPACRQASAVLDCLRFGAENLGVKTECSVRIEGLERNNNCFILNNAYRAKNVVIAAGGRSAPKQGSDGSGLEILRRLGHTLTKTRPALVPLNAEGGFFPFLKGIRCHANAWLFIDGEFIKSEKGEIQFTQSGLSGIAIMQLSSLIARASLENTAIRLDCVSGFDEKELYDFLFASLSRNPERTLENYLSGIVPKRLGQVILKQYGFDNLSKETGSLKKDDIRRIIKMLKGWEIKILSPAGFELSQVTAGGADTDEFDSRSMMSKKLDGLFCTGEILDVDGECGGYNLNWAWSSGRLAGRTIAKRLL